MQKNNKQRHPNEPKVGKNHVWFLNEMPKFKVAVPIIRSATLYISAFEEGKTNLPILLHDIKEFTADDRITLIFNSPGGLISEGRALINAVLNTGADIQTEILSEASSMAAVTFCIGARRIVYENSSLMFHNFSGGYYGKGQEIQDHLHHSIKNISQFFKAHMVGLTDKEIRQMIKGKEFWFCAEEMAERGIATHVSVDGILIPAKRYIKALKKARKKAKKQKVEVNSISEANIYGIDVMSEIIEEQNKAMDEVTNIISDVVGNNEFLYN